MPKGKDKPKGKPKPPAKAKGPAKPPKAQKPPRTARMGKPPIEAEDLFAGTPVAPTPTKAPKQAKGSKILPALPSSDLDTLRAEHAARIQAEDEEAARRSRTGEAPARPLNPRQRLFAEHYVKLGNATQSYKLAGYTGSTEESFQNAASALLGHLGVRQYIGELLDDAAAPRIADAAERHQFLTAMMRGEVKGKSTYYGEEIMVYPSAQDRIKAAELLTKINGELTVKAELKGDLVIRVVRGDSAPSAIGKREGDGE